MANLSKNRRSSTQNVSLYNLYKNRSYRCSVDMMGNALIQPTMYFNVRNIPMFSGPYMITKVTHRISQNGFDTQFEGIRQPFYSLPKIENFIQTLNEKILTSIQEQIQENETKKKNDPNTLINQKNSIMSNVAAEENLTSNQDCATGLASQYRAFTQVESPAITTVTFAEMKRKIIEKLTANNYTTSLENYAVLLFTFMYVDSSTSQGFEAYENNYSTIDLTEFYGAGFFNFINRKYYCVNRGTNVNVPIVSFVDLDSFIQFAITKVNGLLSASITQTGNANEELSEIYVRFYPINRNPDVWTKMDTNDKNYLYDKFKKAIDVYKSLQ